MKAFLRPLVLSLVCLFAATELLRAEDAKSSDKPKSVTPSIKDQGRHDQFLKDKEAALTKGPIDVVFIGDSITDGWRGGEQKRIYDEKWGKLNPYNIGISGDQTQHVLWRIQNGELDGIKPKVAVMMIGTNNLGNNNPAHKPAEVAQGIKTLVEEIKTKTPTTKILLLGVFPRGKEANDHFRAEIKQVNEEIAKLDDGGKTVKYLDIADKFLDKDGKLPGDIMPDALHPNAKGYKIWADAIDPVVQEMAK